MKKCMPRWKREITGPTPSVAAATSRKICFPFHSIARRVYFTEGHHRHHVGRINICQRYYDRATLHFLERSLSRAVTPDDVLLKFLKLCVGNARRRLLRLFKFPRGSQVLRVVCFYGKKCWVRKKRRRSRRWGVVCTRALCKWQSATPVRNYFLNYFDHFIRDPALGTLGFIYIFLR